MDKTEKIAAWLRHDLTERRISTTAFVAADLTILAGTSALILAANEHIAPENVFQVGLACLMGGMVAGIAIPEAIRRTTRHNQEESL